MVPALAPGAEDASLKRLRRWWPGLAFTAMLVALFPDVFIRGQVISANDILYQLPPFNEVAPPEFKPAAVFPVNVIQTGVWLEAGPHSVEFYFRPRGARLGGIVSLCGLAAMLVLAVVVWRSRTTRGNTAAS